MRFQLLILALAAAALTGAARADVTVYQTESSFLAATSGVGTDHFADLNPGDLLNGTLSRQAGSLSYQVSSHDGLENQFYVLDNGAGGAWLSSNRTEAHLVFNGFAPDLRAIGGSFLASTYAGAPWSGARLNITFTDGGGAHTQVLDLSSGSGYIGFVSSTPLQSLDVSLYDSNLTTFPTVQALSLGYAAAAVPEPARPALLLTGLVGLALLKRRAARG